MTAAKEINVSESRRLPEEELTVIPHIQTILPLNQSTVRRNLLRRDLNSKLPTTNILARQAPSNPMSPIRNPWLRLGRLLQPLHTTHRQQKNWIGLRLHSRRYASMDWNSTLRFILFPNMSNKAPSLATTMFMSSMMRSYIWRRKFQRFPWNVNTNLIAWNLKSFTTKISSKPEMKSHPYTNLKAAQKNAKETAKAVSRLEVATRRKSMR